MYGRPETRGGHFEIVRMLVEAGADINHPTKKNSFPIHAACYNGRLDTVAYLISNGASIHVGDFHNNTCLIIASYGGHLSVAKFLLENGANPNEKLHCGTTPLHIAAECGDVGNIIVLLENGAVSSKNDMGLSPLIATANGTQAHVLEYLVTREEFSKEEKIEALELLGACFASDLYYYNLGLAYSYLKRAMELRYSDTENPVLKKLQNPIAAYEYWIETQTLEELQSIQYNVNSLHMESMAIKERVLGVKNPEVVDSVEFQGSVLATEGRFDTCIELWLHALRIRRQKKETVSKNLIQFAEVFCKMLNSRMNVRFSHIAEVLEACIQELERSNEANTDKLLEEHFGQMGEFHNNYNTVLYILIITTKMMYLCSPEEKSNVHNMVSKLVKMQLKMGNGRTLLHSCVDVAPPVMDRDIEDVCKFPCAAAVKLLVECGADVNAMDMKRNTPLHVIASSRDTYPACKIISTLLDAGAHIDVVNIYGEMPFNFAKKDAVLKRLLMNLPYSLKCLAARAVKASKMSCEDLIPQQLLEFIELHGMPTGENWKNLI
ncbi:Palmitoyltransferase Hip14 [Gryllus bimaculatus]|nr:Palmitoyltransferase Hip14 [Gryllus bimaculatus]